MEWDHSFDTVVIGSGVGGFVGAVTAKRNGLEPLLIEKCALLGGSSAMSGGVLWIPNNPLMQRESVPDSYDEGMAYFEDVVGDAGPASSSARRHTYLRPSVELVRFLEGLGMRFVRCEGYSDYYDEANGGKPRGRSIEPVPWNGRKLGSWESRLRPGMAAAIGVAVLTGEVARFAMGLRTFRGFRTAARVVGRTVLGKLTGRRLLTNGASLIGQLLRIAIDDEVTIWTEAPLAELVMADGRVVGVVVTKDGRNVRIKAEKGVLINAGGFARNGELRRRFGQDNDGTWTLANPGDTGEAIEAAMRHGAAVDLADGAWWLPGFIMPDGTPAASIADRTRPGSIIVDSGGNRRRTRRWADRHAAVLRPGGVSGGRGHQRGPAHRRACPGPERAGCPDSRLYASGNSTASVMGRRYLGAGASIGASAVFSYVAMLDAADRKA